MGADLVLRKLFADIKRFGWEFFGLYYGTYRARVLLVEKPHQGLLQLAVPALGDVGQPLRSLAYPRLPMGYYAVPAKGDAVWVSFEGGKLDFPVWEGSWISAEGQLVDGKNSELPPKMTADFRNADYRCRGFWTETGSQIAIDEQVKKQIALVMTDGTVSAQPTVVAYLTLGADGQIILAAPDGRMLTFTKEGGILLTAGDTGSVSLSEQGADIMMAGKACIHMDPDGGISIVGNGNVSVESGGTVQLKGGIVQLQGMQFSAVHGELLMTWLATHVHSCAAPGAPSTQPLVPPLPAILSQTVKVG